MKKYNIVFVDSIFKTSIIDTHLTHKDAIEQLTCIINKEYKTEDSQKYYKIYYESKDEITIYYLGFMGKYLHGKYFIIEFEDKTDLKNF